MHFDLHAVTPTQYAAWVAAAKAGGPTLDAASYAALAHQSANLAPFTYRAVQPGLFQSIVTQQIAPAPGPAETARSDSHVFPKSLEPQ
jgi:cytochrome o ubiquinol oxidase subunit 2